MLSIYKLIAAVLAFMAVASVGYSQQVFKGKIIDALTKEPVVGASVHCSAGCSCGCATNAHGEFELKPRANCCVSFEVSSVGYQPVIIQAGQLVTVVNLQQDNSPMQAVVVTANREGVKRSLAPVAITTISSKMIQDAKPVTLDQVLNKVSGVYMVNLGNEQHSMSIRQPMTTKSLFLYLEDGIPIRTTGLFNHNALLEMNMAAVKNIEVIKGPSSSLYGSEAIGGVVNFITVAPTAVPVAKLSLQANNIGYKRTDLQTAFSKGKWGFALSGYYVDKRNSFIEYTDFHKANLTARVDYHFNEKTSLTNSFTWMDYYSDMTGGIDSIRFVDKSFGSNYTFTYRKVNALRYRSTLSHHWNDNSKTTASVIFRDNSIGQNPAYAIKDDYRRLSNGTWTGKKNLAHGEINEVSFNSYALIAQHKQNLNWKKAVLIGGLNVDISPSRYSAEYIRISKDSVSKVYTGYQSMDSVLTHYKSDINNYAAFANFEFSPVEKLRVVALLRYDLFHYDFNNYLQPSSYSGSPDTLNNFKRVSPKIGFTYNFSSTTGIYANYSEGFVPPQVTEMYKGVKVPELKPSVFYNYEIGGWAELIKGKLSADISVYQLEGTNEIISVRMDDGSSQNMNAGKTQHRGIEFGLNANPVKSISFRLSSALSKHRFTEFVEKGVSYNGNDMNGAPNWMHNAEIWWRPAFVNGLRVGVEWQKIGSYYMDPLNTVRYEGYDVFHVRAGYKWKAMELWVNMMNAADKYYAYTSSKSNSGYSYTPAEPRHFNMGVSYDFGDLFKKK
ncbi:TonB-dependent receptor [Terrimonas pollutisoli]|uniref:TonB-dependent receptor n=1 Tax=Terrimonas pollutisoli TaxID=3034147 RepID=UPI0023EAFF0D|nr:TonB-dependent receptor [Terrimonas sp. H1YJ31]